MIRILFASVFMHWAPHSALPLCMCLMYTAIWGCKSVVFSSSLIYIDLHRQENKHRDHHPVKPGVLSYVKTTFISISNHCLHCMDWGPPGSLFFVLFWVNFIWVTILQIANKILFFQQLHCLLLITIESRLLLYQRSRYL